MRKSILIIFLFAILAVSTSHQAFSQQELTKADQLAAMKKLSFLVGEWKGTAWMMPPQGKKETIVQTEKVEWRLDGTVLMIEGLGKVKNPETGQEEVGHEALGIVNYDVENKTYRFHAYTAEGRATEADAEVGENSLIWQIAVPNGFTVRYTIEINDSGQWFEIGEYSRDGQNWSQFFEMTLDRVNEDKQGTGTRSIPVPKFRPHIDGVVPDGTSPSY
jgi:hypothetical protein